MLYTRVNILLYYIILFHFKIVLDLFSLLLFWKQWFPTHHCPKQLFLDVWDTLKMANVKYFCQKKMQEKYVYKNFESAQRVKVRFC